MTVRIFCSYAHDDEAYRKALEEHLAPQQRAGLIDLWHDRRILPGEDWKNALDHELEQADVILLLVSPAFFASDYVYGVEMTRALERQIRGEVRIIPILVRPVDWELAPFAHLQVLPEDRRPVASWRVPDEAWTSVARSLRNSLAAPGPPSADAAGTPGSRRRQLAHFLAERIRDINGAENWSDGRFAELEAEVEAEGQKRRRFPPRFGSRLGDQLRREPSLSVALERSAETLIVLEGDPGAGKSVALRHLALRMLEKAIAARDDQSHIPLYVNLRGLDTSGTPPDGETIRAYVVSTIRRLNNRYINAFLEREFDRGMADGAWLFLFDSFDEIPAILSSTEAGEIVRQHADAISTFVSGGRCRGVIASRPYRGPKLLGRSRFRILPLSDERRAIFIGRYLEGSKARDLAAWIAASYERFGAMADNPLFLSLICAYVQHHGTFPERAHVAFESFVERRLHRDEQRLPAGITPGQVRAAAEAVAFCMAAVPQLGLQPELEGLKVCLKEEGFEPEAPLEDLLEALQRLRLVRPSRADQGGDQRFSFVHRRFQEYFATCVVLARRELVPVERLLLDGHWRETTVTVLQTQPRSELEPLLEAAARFMREAVEMTPRRGAVGEGRERLSGSRSEGDVTEREPFQWRPGAYYLLGLLQEGMAGRLHELPAGLRADAGTYIKDIVARGDLMDRRWATQVAGILERRDLEAVLIDAFEAQSVWLQEVAFRQAGLLDSISGDVARGIRGTLINLMFDGRLSWERLKVEAYLRRTRRSDELLSVLRLLVAVPTVRMFFIVCWLLLAFAAGGGGAGSVDLSGLAVKVAWVMAAVLFQEATWPELRADAAAALTRGDTSPTSLWIGGFYQAVGFGAVFFVVFLEQSSPLYTLLYVAVAWSALWIPNALLACCVGKFHRPVYWPWLPVLVPVQLARTSSRALILVVLTSAGAFFFMGVVLLLNGVGYTTLLKYLPALRETGFEDVLRWLGYAWTGFLLYTVGRYAYRWGRDLMHWNEQNLWDRSLLSRQALLEHLGRWRTTHYRVRYLRELQRRSPSCPTDLLAVLEPLFHALDRALNASAGPDLPEPPDAGAVPPGSSGEAALEFQHWYQAYSARNSKALAKWGSETLDELGLLIQHLSSCEPASAATLETAAAAPDARVPGPKA